MRKALFAIAAVGTLLAAGCANQPNTVGGALGGAAAGGIAGAVIGNNVGSGDAATGAAIGAAVGAAGGAYAGCVRDGVCGNNANVNRRQFYDERRGVYYFQDPRSGRYFYENGAPYP